MMRVIEQLIETIEALFFSGEPRAHPEDISGSKRKPDEEPIEGT